MNLRQEIPVAYDDIKGWFALSNETFSQPMLLALRQRVYEINYQRLKGFTGDKRKRVEFALSRLQKEGIKIMANPKKGIEMFQSDQKRTTKSYHQIGGK